MKKIIIKENMDKILLSLDLENSLLKFIILFTPFGNFILENIYNNIFIP